MPVQPVALKVILEPLQIVELVVELTTGVGTVVTVTGNAILEALQPETVHVTT